MPSVSDLRVFLTDTNHPASNELDPKKVEAAKEALGFWMQSSYPSQEYRQKSSLRWQQALEPHIIDLMLELADSFQVQSPMSADWVRAMQHPMASLVLPLVEGCFDSIESVSQLVEDQYSTTTLFFMVERVSHVKEQMRALGLSPLQSDALVTQSFVKKLGQIVPRIQTGHEMEAVLAHLIMLTRLVNTLGEPKIPTLLNMSTLGSNGMLLELTVGVVGSWMVKYNLLSMIQHRIATPWMKLAGDRGSSPDAFERGEHLLAWSAGLLEGLEKQWNFSEETTMDPVVLRKINAIIGIVEGFEKAWNTKPAKEECSFFLKGATFKAWIRKKELELNPDARLEPSVEAVSSHNQDKENPQSAFAEQSDPLDAPIVKRRDASSTQFIRPLAVRHNQP